MRRVKILKPQVMPILKEIRKKFEDWVDVDSIFSSEIYQLDIDQKTGLIELAIIGEFGLEYKPMSELAEYFKTTNVNVDQEHFNGCETCGYGEKDVTIYYINDHKFIRSTKTRSY